MTMQQQDKELSSQEQLKNERYLWIARAFSVVAVLSIVANMLLLFAISSLYPLVRVRPYYMNVLDKNQQVVDLVPVSSNDLQDKILIESLIRQYVLARYTITADIGELKDRWDPGGIVYLMSSQDVYAVFVDKYYNDELMEQVEKGGLVVAVKITSVMPKEGNLWEVNFKLISQDQTSVEPKVQELKDVLEVRFDPLYKKTNLVTWQDRLKNPLGFRVVGYGS